MCACVAFQRAVSDAASDAVDKTLLLSNGRPFCSIYNTLKLELVMASPIIDNQAQFVLGSAGERRASQLMKAAEAACAHDAPACPERADYMPDKGMDDSPAYMTRRLQQGGRAQREHMHAAAGMQRLLPADARTLPAADERYGSFFDSGEAMTHGSSDPLAAVLGAAAVPVKRVNTAKLLLTPNTSAALEMPTYAFATPRFKGESNVSIVLASSNSTDGNTRLSLTFGYFESSLFYDPTIYFSHTGDMAFTTFDASSYSAARNLSAACPRGDANCHGRRRGPMSSGGAVPVRGLGMVAASVVGAALLLLLL